MAIERIYNIPLRREWLKAPKYKRAKKAVNAVKKFLAKHMKDENVKLGKYLNLKLWEHGIKNPPHHIHVKVTKDDSGKVFAEIIGAPEEKKETVEEKLKKAQADKTEAEKTEIKQGENKRKKE